MMAVLGVMVVMAAVISSDLLLYYLCSTGLHNFSLIVPFLSLIASQIARI